MLDQLMQIVQQQGQSLVVENNEVPDEKNEAVMAEARDSIFNGLQKMMAEGKTDELTSLLKGGSSITDDNAVMGLLSGDFIEKVTNKLGIDKNTAMSIAKQLIPLVLSKLTNKAKDPNDNSIDFGNILSSLRGGQGGGMAGAAGQIGNMLGLDKDNDGDTDLNDIMGMFK